MLPLKLFIFDEQEEWTWNISNNYIINPFQPEHFFQFLKSLTQFANMEYYETINNNPNKLYIFEKVLKITNKEKKTKLQLFKLLLTYK